MCSTPKIPWPIAMANVVTGIACLQPVGKPSFWHARPSQTAE
jgi:hypothetical protein